LKGYDSKSEGARWIAECCSSTLFVFAQEESERQKIQQGKYILFPNDIKKDGALHFSKLISPIKKTKEQISKRVIIPKEAKARIRNELEVLGVSESMLFSDNIDTACKIITNNAYKIVEQRKGK
jgi:hypothetical protein